MSFVQIFYFIFHNTVDVSVYDKIGNTTYHNKYNVTKQYMNRTSTAACAAMTRTMPGSCYQGVMEVFYSP